MTALAPAGNRWPSRLAYAAAAIFIGCSGAINIAYGFNKGSDLAGSLTWAAVAGAVAIVFALSWAATIRALEAKRWGAAAMCLAALVLSGAYSISAALGSASGGRTSAAAAESASTGARERAKAAWAAAKRELDALATTKPGAELRKLIAAARGELERLPVARTVAEIDARLRVIERDPRRYGCAAINGSMKVVCPKLDRERAQAEHRERLAAQIAKWTADLSGAGQRHTDAQARAQTAMDKAATDLAAIKPEKPANSDAKALAKYLKALGLDIGADRLNDLLVLLAVCMVEAGGGLSLAVGMALQVPPAGARGASVRDASSEPERPRTPLASVQGAPVERVLPASCTPERSVTDIQAAAVLAWLQARGGTAKVSMRRLGTELGRSAGGVHAEIQRLVSAGMLNATATPRGTLLQLPAAARLN